MAFRQEIIEKKPMAEGPWFRIGDKSIAKYLTVSDGGKSVGIDSGVNGGMIYLLKKAKI